MLHAYSIADGIRDKNVLGFDTYKILTFKDRDLRRAVALHMAKAKTEEEAINDPLKSEVYYKYMNSSTIKMADSYDESGKLIKGIEAFVPKTQYYTSEHKNQIIEDIKSNWVTLSHNGKFHAIFATSSIPEAIDYYQLIKKEIPFLKTTCLFDPSIYNKGNAEFKED